VTAAVLETVPVAWGGAIRRRPGWVARRAAFGRLFGRSAWRRLP